MLPWRKCKFISTERYVKIIQLILQTKQQNHQFFSATHLFFYFTMHCREVGKGTEQGSVNKCKSFYFCHYPSNFISHIPSNYWKRPVGKSLSLSFIYLIYFANVYSVPFQYCSRKCIWHVTPKSLAFYLYLVVLFAIYDILMTVIFVFTAFNF